MDIAISICKLTDIGISKNLIGSLALDNLRSETMADLDSSYTVRQRSKSY